MLQVAPLGFETGKVVGGDGELGLRSLLRIAGCRQLRFQLFDIDSELSLSPGGSLGSDNGVIVELGKLPLKILLPGVPGSLPVDRPRPKRAEHSHMTTWRYQERPADLELDP